MSQRNYKPAEQCAFVLRKPCSACRSVKGHIIEKGAQDCVYCTCGRWQYNAPRHETGKAVRPVDTTRGLLKPSKRARILLRDGRACVVCHRTDRPLHVGHILSVQDGHEYGVTIDELDDDENLATMCDECNLGLSGDSLPLWIVASILKARVRGWKKARDWRVQT